jgi:large subunit ribosomal protein L22
MAAVETPAARAEARYVRTAPRKAQLIAEQIRGRPVPEARTILAFMTRDAARDVEKVLASAVANAEANHGLVGDELYVSLATVGAGPTIKRWRARARGRVARIKKRTCHITIALALPEGAETPAPAPAAPEAKPRPAPRKKAEPEEAKPEEAAKPDETAKPARAAEPKAVEAEEKPGQRATKKTEAAKPKAPRRTRKKEGES